MFSNFLKVLLEQGILEIAGEADDGVLLEIHIGTPRFNRLANELYPEYEEYLQQDKLQRLIGLVAQSGINTMLSEYIDNNP